MAKKEISHDYASISICLLGPVGSGKTTFFSGVNRALVMDEVKIGNHCIRLNLRSITNGAAAAKKDSPNVEVSETVSHIENSPQDQLKGMASNMEVGNAFSMFTGNSIPQIGKNSFENVSGNSSNTPEKGAEENEQVKNINIAGGFDNVFKLGAEFEKQFEISEGFRGHTATVRYIILSYDVIIDEEVRCVLQFTDYAGELITLKRAYPESILKLLAGHLENSEAAIVLCNTRDMAEVMTSPTPNNPSMFLVDRARALLGANRINTLITNIDNDAFTFLLALTQVDSPQVKPEVTRNNFKTVSSDLRRNIYNLAFSKVDHKRNWSTGIIPVSAIGTKRNGAPNVDDENKNLLPDAELNQKGIDKALLYCLYTSTLQKMDALEKKIKDASGLFGDRRLCNMLKAQREDLLVVKNVFAENEHFFDDINDKKIALQKVSTLK